MTFLSIARAAALACCIGAFGALVPPSALAAGGLLPEISQTIVYQVDPVDAAAHQECGPGSPELALRDGDAVHYFSTKENMEAYRGHSQQYPDVVSGERLAFFGADPVLRFPHGVHVPDLGPVIAGDLSVVPVFYRGALFRFAYEATKEAFLADPEKYIPAIGGYCPGAMAADHVTPGDPRNTYYIAETGEKEGVWGTFGSPNGPIAWAKMTPDERRAKYATALANYERKTGRADSRDKIAAR